MTTEFFTTWPNSCTTSGRFRLGHDWLFPVSGCEPNAKQPENQQRERQQSGYKQRRRSAQPGGKDLLLSQKKGSRSDEKAKAHAPEMAHDALCSEDAAAHEHAKIPRGCQQHHGTHEKVHPNGNSICGLHMAIHHS